MISLIVPFYRGTAYLKDCLESVRAQGIRDIETILVTDGCLEEDIRFVNDCRNLNQDCLNLKTVSTGAPPGAPLGVACARNVGLAAARGEYILFLDSDDYFVGEPLKAALDKVQAGDINNCMLRISMRKTWYKRDSVLKEYEEESRAAAESATPEAGIAAQSTVSEAGTVMQSTVSEAGTAKESATPEAGVAMQDGVRGKEAGRKESDISDGDIFETALATLIPAAAIGDTRFDTTLRYYCDLPFIARIATECDFVQLEEDGYYYKRNHNDAVRMPALSQEHCGTRYEEYGRACAAAEAVLKDNVRYGGYMRFACKNALHIFIKGKHPVGLELPAGEVESVSNTLRNVSDECLEAYDYKCRRILRKFRSGNINSALRAAKFYVMNKKKRGLFGSAEQWKWNIYKRIFRKFSIKPKLVLFESFLGKSYGDSCRAIYEYMIKVMPDRKYVWIIDNKDAKIPGRHKEAKPMSLKYFYYVARCGAWINNMRQPAWYEKRKGVTFLETWHGTPLKKLVFDMEDVHSASPEYKMTFYKQSRIWDYLISDNRFSTDAFKSAFLYPEEQILEMGYPRNDLLYAPDADEKIRRIKSRIGIPEGKKVVLYAPTWRDDDYYGPGKYKFDLPLDLSMMRRLRDEYVFVLRTHYFIADHLVIEDGDRDFVFDCSRYNDIAELYLISDVLITDYSSVFFDYANLRRPILFYVYDFDKYRDTLRGFYFDMETGCPGPLLRTNEEVLHALENIDGVEKEYAQRYEEFCSKFCSLDDGHAAERIVKKVFNVNESNS